MIFFWVGSLTQFFWWLNLLVRVKLVYTPNFTSLHNLKVFISLLVQMGVCENKVNLDEFEKTILLFSILVQENELALANHPYAGFIVAGE